MLAHTQTDPYSALHDHSLEPVDYLPFDPFTAAGYVFLLVVAISLISLAFQKWVSEKAKKIFFIIVALTVGLTTIYAAGTTIYLNLISESGGPVHWHADYEIWVCGEHITNLQNAVFPSNKVGTSTLHHHDDFRMHVEGLVIHKSDVSLEKFFQAIGGDFTGASLTLKMKDESEKTVSNGELCNGKAGKWRLYLKNNDTGKFEENFELQNYVLKPFFNIPPGDFIKLVFDSKEGAPNGS